MPISLPLRPRTFLLASLAAALFFSCRSGPPAPGRQDPASCLPSAEEAGEWASEGSPAEYAGEDLYLYIDGGAEIYREYGFETVLVQDYVAGTGARLSLDGDVVIDAVDLGLYDALLEGVEG